MTGPFSRGVVVTSDEWNDRMASVGVIPVVRPEEVDRAPGPPWVIPSSMGMFVPGRKLDVEAGLVGPEVSALDPGELRTLEDSWIDLLDLRALLRDPPTFPSAGPGGSHPRWASVYYADRRVGGERKFYVICSPDVVNAVAPAVTLIRCTSTPRGDVFPRVSRDTHACAGNITTFPVRFLDLAARPPLRSVRLDDMRRIAAAVAITHALHDALGVAVATLEHMLSPRDT